MSLHNLAKLDGSHNIKFFIDEAHYQLMSLSRERSKIENIRDAFVIFKMIFVSISCDAKQMQVLEPTHAILLRTKACYNRIDFQYLMAFLGSIVQT